MLGQPALVAGHDRGDAQRVALLAQQGVAAVAGAVGPDHPLLGELDDVLGVAARPGDVLLAGGERRADRVQGGHERRRRAPRSAAAPWCRIRAMTRIETTTYAESVISTPNIGLLGLEVAHDERDDVHRATAHRPAVEVGHDRLHLVRRHPVVGGTGVLLVDRADEGAVLDPGDVAGVGGAVEGVGLLVRVEPGERAGLDELVGQRGPLLRRSRCTQWMRSGVVSAATSSTQAREPRVGRAAITRDVGPGRERLGLVCCRGHLLGHPFRGPVLAAHVRCGEAFRGPAEAGVHMLNACCCRQRTPGAAGATPAICRPLVRRLTKSVVVVGFPLYVLRSGHHPRETNKKRQASDV